MPTQFSIVTGGSSGLGFEIAKLLAERNNNVCIIGRNKDKLLKAKSKLLDINPNVKILDFSINVGDEKQVKKMFDEFDRQQVQINKLFNAAGVGRFGRPEEISQDIINAVFEANLIGLMLMTSYCLRAMKDSEGLIVNIMSKSSLVGRPNDSVYCAAKWGAKGFTESVRLATQGTSIKVIGIYPGGIKTDFWNSESMMPSDIDKYMDPADVAREIVDISLRESSCILSDVVINRNV